MCWNHIKNVTSITLNSEKHTKNIRTIVPILPAAAARRALAFKCVFFFGTRTEVDIINLGALASVLLILHQSLSIQVRVEAPIGHIQKTKTLCLVECLIYVVPPNRFMWLNASAWRPTLHATSALRCHFQRKFEPTIYVVSERSSKKTLDPFVP